MKSSADVSFLPEPPLVRGPRLSMLRLPTSWSMEPSLYARAMDRHTRGQVLAFNVLPDDPARVRRFDAGQFGLLTAHVYPKGRWERLAVCNDWHAWLFLFDDEADEQADVGQRPEYLAHYVEACLRVLRGGRPGARATPLERFTYQLRQRMSSLASEMWMERFIHDVEDYLLRGTLPAARHWTDGTVPALEPYIEQRALDSGVYTALDLVEFAEPGQELPEELFRLPLVQRMRQLCTRVVALTNDLFSFEKEVLWHRNPNNFIHVLGVNQGLGLEEAIFAGIELINSDTDAFIACEEALLASRLSDPRVLAYVEGMKAWIRGNVHWSLVTGRYSSPTSPFPELRR
ncbi:terpene synthase family protein [Melittangium boletus]|uniref:terpene synthase family protein n=1 Tax=Melittangium boletus TaxID=83453 RepID=UPI003DA2C2D8